MAWAALIIVLVSGFFAAGLAFVTAWTIGRFRTLPYSMLVFIAGGFVVGIVVSTATITGWPASIWRGSANIPIDQVLPYMAELKQHEPSLYERISTLIARDQQDGRSEMQVQDNALVQVMSYVADKSPKLSDALIYDLNSLTRDELAYLDERQEFDACALLALGGVRGDINRMLSPELLRRQEAVFRQIIAARAMENGNGRMGAEQFSVMANQAFGQAAQATGVEARDIEAILSGSGDRAQTCRLMKAFFDVILAQPADVAASALRAMAAGERQPHE